jgi:hypothetical protein
VHAGLAEPGYVAITVSDSGVGLPPDVVAAPFEPRRRRSAKAGGAGLGLSITKGIVTAHGGALEIKAAQAGASFLVRLPIEDGPVPLPGGDARSVPRDPQRNASAPQNASAQQKWRKEAVGRGRASR